MLKLKIPPPVVGLTLGALMLLVNHLLPMLNIGSTWLNMLAYPFFVVGLLIEIWSVALFIKARTTVNPLKPNNSNHLVTTGMYRFTRNPMYLGMALLLTGLVFWVGNPVGFIMPALFVLYITRFQIKPEEEVLGEIFGEQFRRYEASVRRWL